MDFLEILKIQGLSELQIREITNTMKKNRVFVTNEEKIEERYRKMKLQRDCLRYKLDLAERAVLHCNGSSARITQKVRNNNGEEVRIKHDKCCKGISR